MLELYQDINNSMYVIDHNMTKKAETSSDHLGRAVHKTELTENIDKNQWFQMENID